MNSAENLFLRNRVRNQITAADSSYKKDVWSKLSHFLTGIRDLRTVDTIKVERCFKSAVEAGERDDAIMMNFWIEQLMYSMYTANFREKSKESLLSSIHYRYTCINQLTTAAYTSKPYSYQRRTIYTR